MKIVTFYYIESLDSGTSNSLLTPDFNIKDSDGQSVLSLCLWNGSINYAKQLIGMILDLKFY